MQRANKIRRPNALEPSYTGRPVLMHSPIAATSIESLIIDVRGERVLLDADVAALYGVETRAVNQAVRRNLDKFPNGYILELTSEESAYLRKAKDSRSQIVILNSDNKKQGRVGNGRHTKYNYKAFTEKGLYMLATILLTTNH